MTARRVGAAVLFAVLGAVVTPGAALADVRTHGTYYDKINCQRTLTKVYQPSDPSRVWWCASNGGPGSSTPTSWTLYSRDG